MLFDWRITNKITYEARTQTLTTIQRHVEVSGEDLCNAFDNILML